MNRKNYKMFSKNRDTKEEIYVRYRDTFFLEKDCKKIADIKGRFAILDLEAFGTGEDLIKNEKENINRFPFYCGILICEIKDGKLKAIEEKSFNFINLKSEEELNFKQNNLGKEIEKYLTNNRIKFIFTYFNKMEITFFKEFVKTKYTFIDIYLFTKTSLFSFNRREFIFGKYDKSNQNLNGKKVFFEASKKIFDSNLSEKELKDFINKLNLYNSQELSMLFKFLDGLLKKYLNKKNQKYLIKKV
ncbi:MULTISPECIES: hypothetical protein [Mesoplasma]|uniref:Uncharacterized protein n=1 Tax=Mesoplasma florum TaxID=2151 RepID=A0A2R3P7C0_MESFO|nr:MULTISPECIES: hypothetical protein [Mesoplasma]AVN64387.1 hypothetical protein CG003_01755 [Mesoplasma florum]